MEYSFLKSGTFPLVDVHRDIDSDISAGLN